MKFHFAQVQFSRAHFELMLAVLKLSSSLFPFLSRLVPSVPFTPFLPLRSFHIDITVIILDKLRETLTNRIPKSLPKGFLVPPRRLGRTKLAFTPSDEFLRTQFSLPANLPFAVLVAPSPFRFSIAAPSLRLIAAFRAVLSLLNSHSHPLLPTIPAWLIGPSAFVHLHPNVPPFGLISSIVQISRIYPNIKGDRGPNYQP